MTDSYEPPSGDVPGHLLVRVGPLLGGKQIHRREYEILDEDLETSVFWMHEGVGVEEWLDEIDFPSAGTYYIGNIVVYWSRGLYGGESDEDWEHDEPVRLGLLGRLDWWMVFKIRALKSRWERWRRPTEDKFAMPPVCNSCMVYLADPPSPYCPGCQEYQEHQR